MGLERNSEAIASQTKTLPCPNGHPSLYQGYGVHTTWLKNYNSLVA
ncbi:hypothetical protein [Nostoc sp. WHI]|nr:hypothetical protein [Nostoc sp. WHI]